MLDKFQNLKEDFDRRVGVQTLETVDAVHTVVDAIHMAVDTVYETVGSVHGTVNAVHEVVLTIGMCRTCIFVSYLSLCCLFNSSTYVAK